MAEDTRKSRKKQDATETGALLFLGLLACGYLKIDTQLYTVFAACLVGKSGVFNWGNAKEHDALAKVDVAKAALPVVPGQ